MITTKNKTFNTNFEFPINAKIKGKCVKSLAFNQLVPTNKVTTTVSIANSVTETTWGDLIGTIDVPVGHKVLAKITTSDNRLRVCWGNNTNDFANGVNAGVTAQTDSAGIYDVTSEIKGNGSIYYRTYAGLPAGTYTIKLQLCDLTVLGWESITIDQYNALFSDSDYISASDSVISGIEEFGTNCMASILRKQNVATNVSESYDNIYINFTNDNGFSNSATNAKQTTLIANHKYLIYVEFDNDLSEFLSNPEHSWTLYTFNSSKADRVDFSPTSTYRKTREMCDIFQPNLDRVYLTYRHSGAISSSIAKPKKALIIDLTQFGLDALTAQQFYNLYKDKFDQLANGDTIGSVVASPLYSIPDESKKCVMNQLVENGNFESDAKWNFASTLSHSISNNELTISTTITDQTPSFNQQTFVANENHTYLIHLKAKKVSGDGVFRLRFPAYKIFDLTSEYQDFYYIWTGWTGQTYLHFQLYSNDGNEISVKIKDINIHDLTLLYGPGNEPTTLEEIPDKIKNAYHEYDTGSFDYLEDKVGDEWEDKVKTRKVGVVDLGTLSWNYASVTGHERFSTDALNNLIRKPLAGNIKANILCSIYKTDTDDKVYLHSEDKIIGVYTTGKIEIYDSSYTDATTFKSSLSGILLYYELNTPTTNETQHLLTTIPGKNTIVALDGNDNVMANVEQEIKYNEGKPFKLNNVLVKYMERRTVKKITEDGLIIYERPMLPVNFDEYESLENQGVSYIDTGIEAKSTSSYKVVIDLEFNYLPGACTICGAYSSLGLGQLIQRELIAPLMISSDKKIGYGYARGSTVTGTFSNLTCVVGKRYLIETTLEQGNQSLKVDGEEVVSGTSTQAPVPLASLGLYGLLSGSSFVEKTISDLSYARIYSFKIIKDGILVQDLVPCHDAHQEKFAMLDSVTGKILTSGSTEFENGTVYDSKGYTIKGKTLKYNQLAGNVNHRIFGMSRKATQLVENGNFESKSGWDAIRSTLNVSNNIAKLTINELTSVGNGNRIVRTVRDLVVGHKYLARYYVKSPKNAEISIQFYQSRYVLDNSTNVVANTRTLMSGIFTAEAVSGTIYLAIKDSLRDNFSVGDTVEFDIAMVNDLTQDFGAGNEPTTVEQALEYYPKPYMAYTGQKGTIINAGGECVASGRQLWNEQTKKGYYDGSNGNYVYNENQLCSDGDIKVKPNTIYYSNLSTLGTTWRIVYLNANKEFISSTAMSSNTFTTPSNCEYIRFGLGSLYGATYNNNVLFQEATYTDTTYTQYISPKHFTLPPLRGTKKAFKSMLGKQNIGATFTQTNVNLLVYPISNNSFNATGSGGTKQIATKGGHKYFVYVKLTGLPTILYPSRCYFRNSQEYLGASSFYQADGFICSINSLAQDYYGYHYVMYNIGSSQTIELKVDEMIIIDLTSLGLDNLTAQQFYDKYHADFPKLANGNYSGLNNDTQETATGNTQRKFSEVDLGTLNWLKQGEGTAYSRIIVRGYYNLFKGVSSNQLANILCSYYKEDTGDHTYLHDKDKSIAYSGNNTGTNNLSIYDTSFIDSNNVIDLVGWSSFLNGVNIIGELQTYTTEQNQSFGLGKGITRITDQNGYELEFEVDNGLVPGRYYYIRSNGTETVTNNADTSAEFEYEDGDQVIDLTSVYGSGHEPTTLTAFKETDLYDLLTEKGSFEPNKGALWTASNVKKFVWNQLAPITSSSQTVNGITFTNNGDGSWTVNGTATADARYQVKSFTGTKGHVLVIRGAPIGSSFTTYFMCNDNILTESKVDIGYGSIFTWNYDFSWSFDIRVKSGVTVDNVKFYPQCYDLTEIFGAGNEPTTLEAFNNTSLGQYLSLYGYLPYSAANTEGVVDSAMVMSGRNLLDISKIADTTHIQNLGGGKIKIINSYATDLRNKYGDQLILKELCPSLKVGDNVVFNSTTSSLNRIYLQQYGASLYANTPATITEEMLNSYAFMYGTNGETVIISDIRVYYSSETDTTYTPYIKPDYIRSLAKIESLLGVQNDITTSGSGLNSKISNNACSWSNIAQTPFNKQITNGHKYFVYLLWKALPSESSPSAFFFMNESETVKDNSTFTKVDNSNYGIIVATSSYTLGYLYRYWGVSNTTGLDKLLIVDLTERGLDNLTAQQFYNIYKDQFGALASGLHGFIPVQLNGVNAIQDSYNNQTGKLDRKLSEVDLGTLAYSYDGANGRFYSRSLTFKGAEYRDLPNALCSKYETSSIYLINSSLVDKAFSFGSDNNLMKIIDADFTDNPTTFKSAMNGVPLVYELATYTTETLYSRALPKGYTHVTSEGVDLDLVIN